MTHRPGLVLVLTLPWLLLGCGSGDASPPPFDDIDVAGNEANPDGLPYPTEDVGGHPRNGVVFGNRIPNFAFQGYVDSDTSLGLRTVSMADYYDPDGNQHKLLNLVGVAGWCPHCQAETRAMAAAAPALQNDGVVVVQAMWAGLERDRDLSLEDVTQWIDTMGTSFTVVIDAKGRRVGTVADVQGVPWNALIDLRTMEIIDVTAGELPDWEAYARAGLEWTRTHAPRS